MASAAVTVAMPAAVNGAVPAVRSVLERVHAAVLLVTTRVVVVWWRRRSPHAHTSRSKGCGWTPSLPAGVVSSGSPAGTGTGTGEAERETKGRLEPGAGHETRHARWRGWRGRTVVLSSCMLAAVVLPAGEVRGRAKAEGFVVAHEAWWRRGRVAWSSVVPAVVLSCSWSAKSKAKVGPGTSASAGPEVRSCSGRVEGVRVEGEWGGVRRWAVVTAVSARVLLPANGRTEHLEARWKETWRWSVATVTTVAVVPDALLHTHTAAAHASTAASPASSASSTAAHRPEVGHARSRTKGHEEVSPGAPGEVFSSVGGASAAAAVRLVFAVVGLLHVVVKISFLVGHVFSREGRSLFGVVGAALALAPELVLRVQGNLVEVDVLFAALRGLIVGVLVVATSVPVVLGSSSETVAVAVDLGGVVVQRVFAVPPAVVVVEVLRRPPGLVEVAAAAMVAASTFVAWLSTFSAVAVVSMVRVSGDHG